MQYISFDELILEFCLYGPECVPLGMGSSEGVHRALKGSLGLQPGTNIGSLCKLPANTSPSFSGNGSSTEQF